MGNFFLPTWLKQHLFTYDRISDVSEERLNRIKTGLAGLNSDSPDVSIVIPVWNEENNILKTLSSLSEIKTNYKCELILVNNNSTDNTQELIDSLGVRSVFE